jgi:acyl-CoA reductase-like NAD-dependent aldehyde dehydrogenase
MAATHVAEGIGAVEVPRVPTGLFIDGAWRDAADGATFDVVAPASEEHLATIAAAGDADVDAAVAAARAQVDGGEWARMHGRDRGLLLYRLADAIEREIETFATLEALDIGRPAFEPRLVDIPHVVDVFRHFAGWADKIEGRWLAPAPFFGMQRQAYTIREPVGVVGAISAWNAPALIASWKLGPALAAGNAVVLKPAEDASLSTLFLATLIEEVGFPAGTVNVIPGLGATAGAALVRHPGVDKLSFTGSPEVGREIAVEAARTFKKVTLELGGKSPQIVLGDANLEAVVPGLAQGFFGNQGEICAAGTRILVQRSLYDDVVQGLGEAAKAVRLGDPFDEATQMGALINAKQRDRVTGYIAQGSEEGATLVAGGGTPDRKGFFVEPTVFAGGGNDLTIAQEEIFGPVLSVIPYGDEDEAVRIANDSDYGLAGTVWTSDQEAGVGVARRVRTGTYGVNTYTMDFAAPFGGYKASGLGREFGPEGLAQYSELKSVYLSSPPM